MKIIHLSDLHFGTEAPDLLAELLKSIAEQKADYAIISGDFTQIGSQSEFEKAHHFLSQLPCPYIAIPGNHDVPALNIWERLTRPYSKYKEFITSDLNPVYKSDHCLIAGLNSARRALPHWNWANGAVSSKQRQNLREFYKDYKGWRICTLHHPVHKVQEMPIDVTVFGRKRTLDTFYDLKIDLVLTGHVHHASVTTLGDHVHQCVYVSASTALSSRTRNHENGYNVIDLQGNQMIIDILAFHGGAFKPIKRFEHLKMS